MQKSKQADEFLFYVQVLIETTTLHHLDTTHSNQKFQAAHATKLLINRTT